MASLSGGPPGPMGTGKLACGKVLHMPRAIWSGSISFGLVNVPVKLFSAVSRKTVNFNQIDSKTGARIKMKRVSTADDREVGYDEIVKGYDLGGGQYVTVSDDEMAALDPEAVRTIDIEEFVDLAEIDPLFYDSGYYLVPDQTTAKAYKLLVTAMEESQKVGLALVSMAKAARPGKIFIDWSQNSRHKTTIAPYSMRAKDRPSVSTPISWDEVDAGARGEPLEFETVDVLERVELLGDLFAGTATLQQELPRPKG